MPRTRRATTCTLPLLVLAVALATPPGAARAQESLETRAAAAFTASDWAGARELYAELGAAGSEDPAVWFRLGLATLNAGGEPAAAVDAYRKALALGNNPGPALFGIARAHALAGEDAAVLATLGELEVLGPSLGVARRLASDEAFDRLRADEAFGAAVERLTPCRAEAYRQFDFWLGEWEVRSPQDQVVGRNTITEELDGCLLIERWESAGAQKGLSINYYDRATDTWYQTYRDNTGNVGAWPDLAGGLVDGAMVLESPADAEPRTRWTWTPISADKVRQMAESSSDGGETWTVVWDSYYLRVDG